MIYKINDLFHYNYINLLCNTYSLYTQELYKLIYQQILYFIETNFIKKYIILYLYLIN